ncbi:MAG: PP0621 family protein [Pseudomonadota bacterium]
MSRLLFWIALAVLVVAAIRSKLRAITPPPPGPRAGPAAPERDAEAMACCAHCGVHFPASEAVRADGLDYCCPAHVRLPPLR